MHRFPLMLVSLVALALVASVASAYTVYLKDGSHVVAKEKYTVRGEKAIITLPNGTQTFLALSEIDVERTDKSNESDYGTAMVLEGGEVKVLTSAPPPPPRKTLTDLINNKTATLRELPESRREPPLGPGQSVAKTKAGYDDLLRLERTPFRNVDVAGTIQGFAVGRGLERVQIYQGTRSQRALLEITTNSEASVFRSLLVAANCLLAVRDSHPDQIDAFELVLITPGRARAGQFVLFPEDAADLIARRVELTAFYIDHVQF